MTSNGRYKSLDGRHSTRPAGVENWHEWNTAIPRRSIMGGVFGGAFGGDTTAIVGCMRPWIHPSEYLCCTRKNNFAHPSQSEGSPMNFRQERRAVERTWRDRGALVVVPELRSVYSCRVRDLSIKGAELQLPTEVALVPTDSNSRLMASSTVSNAA